MKCGILSRPAYLDGFSCIIALLNSAVEIGAIDIKFGVTEYAVTDSIC
jgi:hypothetical protein